VGCRILQAVLPTSFHGGIWYCSEEGVHIDWSRWKGWLRGRG
jgi:hypothetical protein